VSGNLPLPLSSKHPTNMEDCREEISYQSDHYTRALKTPVQTSPPVSQSIKSQNLRIL